MSAVRRVLLVAFVLAAGADEARPRLALKPAKPARSAALTHGLREAPGCCARRDLATSDEGRGSLGAALRLQGGSLSLAELRVPFAFAMWYLLSIVYSIENKKILGVWNFPCFSALMQLVVGSIWILLQWAPLPFGPLRTPPDLSGAEIRKLLPVSTFLALGHLLSTVAPAFGTVAFTNVVKTAEPLLTCLFSAVLFGEIFSLPVYLTLIPIIAGVCIATANEVSFSMISLVAGLLSNVAFAMRAISAKSVMKKPLGKNLTAQNLYAVLTLQALVLLLPITLAAEGPRIVAGTQATIAAVGAAGFAKMLLLTGISHYMYNEAAFIALSSVHPVTHAVANTIKRIVVIVVSVLYFRDPLTLTGGIGSAVAILGVMLYSLAKAKCG